MTNAFDQWQAHNRSGMRKDAIKAVVYLSVSALAAGAMALVFFLGH